MNAINLSFYKRTRNEINIFSSGGMYYSIYENHGNYWMYQLIKHDKEDLFQTLIALQK